MSNECLHEYFDDSSQQLLSDNELQRQQLEAAISCAHQIWHNLDLSEELEYSDLSEIIYDLLPDWAQAVLPFGQTPKALMAAIM